jgi:plasmid stabilization system protein ParE
MDRTAGQGHQSGPAEAVATVVYSPRALDHLERAFEFLAEHDPASAQSAAGAIRSAVELLADHPFLGRPMEGGLHQLVISFGKTGYVAMYRFLPHLDEVRVLALRHQRELDYPD